MYIASHVLMIRPANFGFNTQTSADNKFHDKAEVDSIDIPHEQALIEFDQMVQALRAVGINVHVFEDSPTPIKNDAVFSNNWISFHLSGEIIQYPLFASNRRTERRQDIVQYFLDSNPGYTFVDLSEYEKVGVYLESTGSMVFDRRNRKAYACESLRTHPGFFERYCQYFGWEPTVFQAFDKYNLPIYHTNVMMALGDKFAIICAEVVSEEQRGELIDQIEAGGRTCIQVSETQMGDFACNVLELENDSGDSYLVLSKRALNSLTNSQIAQLESFSELLPVSLDCIEKVGGGGARCMLTEVFSTQI